MSVRHHEQLVSHQQREFLLTQSLTECMRALELSLSTLRQHCPDVPVPNLIAEAVGKYSNGMAFAETSDHR